MQLPVRISITLGEETFTVRTLTGSEELHELGRFVVRFYVPVASGLEPDEITGSQATLTFARGSDIRTLTRVVARASRGAARRADRTGSPIEVTLVSRYDTLRHTSDQRIFRDKDVPSIVTEVLSDYGIKVRRALSRQYAILPYTVQWRESCLEFCQRLLAEEGIFSFADDDDVIVLGDSPAAYDLGPDLPFREASALDGGDDAVFQVGSKKKLIAGKVTFRDFDFQKPSLDCGGAVSTGVEGPEIYVYPGKNPTPAGGAQSAGFARDALSAAANQITGSAFAIALRPGLLISIGGSPMGDLSCALVKVTYDFDEAHEGFAVQFAAVQGESTWRPNALSPDANASKPSIPQLMIGYVTGPAGADIHTDEWGRVKLHFPWDRRQPADDNASDWVPTLQDNTGHSVGIPRVGWEMLVGYLEADPDRPVILGRVYNPLDDFPVTLPDRKMFTSLRSLSSPRSQTTEQTGENEILFDDTLGYERISMLAEKDRTVEIENDRMETTYENEVRRVERDEFVDIGHDRILKVGQSRMEMVGNDRKESVGVNRTLKIGADSQSTIKGNRSVKIGGSHTRRVGEHDSVQTGNLKEKIGALQLEAAVDNNSSRSEMLGVSLVGGLWATIAGENASRTTKLVRVETIGALLMQKAKINIQLRVKEAMTRTVLGSMTANAGDDVAMTAPKGLTLKVGSLILKAKKNISFAVGSTKIALEKDTIDFNTGTIKATATAENILAAKLTEQIQ